MSEEKIDPGILRKKKMTSIVPPAFLSKQKKLKTFRFQTITCEGKSLWSQIKKESQEATNTLLEKP